MACAGTDLFAHIVGQRIEILPRLLILRKKRVHISILFCTQKKSPLFFHIVCINRVFKLLCTKQKVSHQWRPCRVLYSVVEIAWENWFWVREKERGQPEMAWIVAGAVIILAVVMACLKVASDEDDRNGLY